MYIRKRGSNGVGKNVPSHNPPETIPCLTQLVYKLKIYIVFGLEALRLHSKKITPLCFIVVIISSTKSLSLASVHNHVLLGKTTQSIIELFSLC